MASTTELIAQLLGRTALPTVSSEQGAYGAYGASITADQAQELARILGFTDLLGRQITPENGYVNGQMPVLGGQFLNPSGGYAAVPGTLGGVSLGFDPNTEGGYVLSYTPNVEGTNTALRQGDAAGNAQADMLGKLIVGGILGAGLSATDWSSMFGGAPASDGMAAFNQWAAENGWQGLPSFEGTAGGLPSSFDGLDIAGDAPWSTLNAGADSAGEQLVEGVNAFNWEGQLYPYGEVVGSSAPGFSMSSGLTNFLGSLGIDASGLTGADLAMLGKVGLLGGGLLAGNSALGGGLAGGGGSSGGGGSYTDAANATAEQNLLNMLIASGLNHPNQSNPYGSSTWTQDPMTGQWTNSTQFSPGQQALYDQSTQGNLLAGGLANQALTANANKIINPIDFSALPKAPVSPGTTAYDAIMSRLNPQIEADRSSQATALANSGLDIGGKAYSEAMRLSGQRENDLRLQAASAAIPLDETARKNALQEQTLASQLPLSNINALRTGSQPTMPNFGQTWTPANPAQGADLLSALGMQNSYNLGQQNLATATSNANKQGLWGLGTSLLGSDSFWNWLS